MPQLKISDVEKQIEELEEKINEKFTALVAELNAALSEVNTDGSVDTSKLEAELNQLRNDLVGHVGVYNKHIKQLHIGKK